ncbi:hypothetical protein DAEQUDRAFT_756222 [Daedalea quercina L-15889]|uniref:Glucosamine 6-phosphate N-acetyltransferase n=1 Tax=Daedalea quercina L-15889 TaxID=1314783 RepID=A0A165RCP1_9APHY|nr:hypothetical protein DAEQUDRAFT_756222 [Daedalea quercina L-15889]
MTFTPDSQLDLLFPAERIPDETRRQLHSDFHLRPLASTDYRRGHLSVLSALSTVNDPGEDAWVTQFNTLRAVPCTYYTIVIIDKASDRIVATGTIFIERKFTRGLRSVAHIEDVAVDTSRQDKKLGLRIVQVLASITENSGCCMITGNCIDSNIPFYEKCGGEWRAHGMACGRASLYGC